MLNEKPICWPIEMRSTMAVILVSFWFGRCWTKFLVIDIQLKWNGFLFFFFIYLIFLSLWFADNQFSLITVEKNKYFFVVCSLNSTAKKWRTKKKSRIKNKFFITVFFFFLFFVLNIYWMQFFFVANHWSKIS